MIINEEIIENIEKSFDSLNSYKISKDSHHYTEMEIKNTEIFKNYVDIWDPERNFLLKDILNCASDQKHHFLIGRKGSGKTTLIERAILECDLSLKDSSTILKNKKYVGVFFALSKNFIEVSHKSEEDFEKLELIRYIRSLFKEIIKKIKIKLEEINKFVKEDNKENKNLIERTFKEITEIISNGENLVDETIFEKVKNTLSRIKNLHISLNGIDFEKELKNIEDFRFFAAGTIWRKIDDLLAKLDLDHLYLFFDEYSELKEKLNQKVVYDNILSTIIGDISIQSIYITLCSYPNQYYYGKQDINKHFRVFDLSFIKINNEKNYYIRKEIALNYIDKVIFKRFKNFFDINENDEEIREIMNSIFPDNFLETLFFASMVITRDIGTILSYCNKPLAKNKKIGKNDLTTSIEKTYEYIENGYFNKVKGDSITQYSKKEILFDKELLKFLVTTAKKKQLNDKGSDRYAYFSIYGDYMIYLERLVQERILNIVDGPKASKGANKDLRSENPKLYTYMIPFGKCSISSIVVSDKKSNYKLWTGSYLDYNEELKGELNSLYYFVCSKNPEHKFEPKLEELLASLNFECPKCGFPKGELTKEFIFEEGLKIQDNKEPYKSPFANEFTMGILGELYQAYQEGIKIPVKASFLAKRLDVSSQKIGAVLSWENKNSSNYIREIFNSIGPKQYQITEKGIEEYEKYINDN